jgi:hypothetical protein
MIAKVSGGLFGSGGFTHFDPPAWPILLIGKTNNLVFLEDRREVSTQEGEAFTRDLGCEFLETSTWESANVTKAFHDLIRLIRRSRMLPSKARDVLVGGPRKEKTPNSGVLRPRLQGVSQVWKRARTKNG